jgi:hypothetical protein
MCDGPTALYGPGVSPRVSASCPRQTGTYPARSPSAPPDPCHAPLVERYDPYQHTRELYTENLWLRELVTAAPGAGAAGLEGPGRSGGAAMPGAARGPECRRPWLLSKGGRNVWMCGTEGRDLRVSQFSVSPTPAVEARVGLRQLRGESTSSVSRTMGGSSVTPRAYPPAPRSLAPALFSSSGAIGHHHHSRMALGCQRSRFSARRFID